MPLPLAESKRSDLLLLAVVLIWGTNFVVIKAALATMHPHVMNAFRLTVSAVVLGVWHAGLQTKAKASFFAPLKTHGKSLIGLGFLGYFAYQLCFILGLSYTTAGTAALIMASVPLWTAVLGTALKLDRLTLLSWMGLAIVLMGTALIVTGGPARIDFSSETFVGNVIMLGAAMMWGSYTALSKPALRQIHPISLTFLGLFFALPLLFVLALPYWGSVAWAEINGWVWLAILFSGGLSTGLATALWNRAVQAVGPAQTAVYGNLTPLVALLSSVVFLAEPITALQLAGGATVILGLLVTRRGRVRPA